MDDISIVYYTANLVHPVLGNVVRENLLSAVPGTPIISVSQVPMDFGENIVVDPVVSHVNIYRQALVGVMAAKTKYIALAEDDVLYSPDHFLQRSSPGVFAYNMASWSIFTWSEPPIFSYRGHGRKVLLNLICERDLFIEAMEERFAKYPDESMVRKELWAEPGKYERQLGVTERVTEEFYSKVPNVVFSHEQALAFSNLGRRKKHGQIKAIEIPYWGRASELLIKIGLLDEKQS